MIESFTEERVRTAMDELGVELDFDAFAKLVRAVPYSEPKDLADCLYLLAYEAVNGPHGYGYQYRAGATLLVACDGDRFVVGVQRSTTASRPFPPWGWKIERWSKDAAKNREKVAAWAKTATKDVVVGKLVRRPVRAEVAPADRDDGASLLATVIANADDTAARAVYADWLLDRGDPRGELIRLHQEGKDTRELDRKHAAVILAPYAAFDAGTRVSSGFVDELSAYAAKLAKHPSVFEREPFRSLHLVAMKPDDLAKLAKACGSHLARITTLRLEGRKSAKHHAPVKTQPSVLAPLLPRLTALHLQQLAETLTEWRALLSGLQGPVEELSIDSVPRAVFDVLGEPGVLPALRHIRIDYQGWADRRGRAEVVTLAKSLARRNLASVFISSWHPGSDAMVAVVQTLLEAPKTKVTIDNCSLEEDAKAVLARHTRVTILRC